MKPTSSIELRMASPQQPPAFQLSPQIRAVVGYVPSGVTWAGIGRDPSSQPRAAWTLRGKPIAFVPAPTNPDPALLSAISAGGGAQRITPWFLACLRDAESAERAAIGELH